MQKEFASSENTLLLLCGYYLGEDKGVQIRDLDPKFDTATWPFLKINKRHGA